MALALLLAATLLLVSPAAAAPPSATLQELTQDLSAARREDAGFLDAFMEIMIGQNTLKDMLTELKGRVTPGPEECPDGWSLHENSCYLIPPLASNWYGAQHRCAALDRRARLASVPPSSLDYVESLVAASSADGVWLGLIKLESGDWAWNDGSMAVINDDDWSPGEPSMDGNCGHIFGPGDNLRRDRLNDRPCVVTLNFLCQITLK